LTSARLLTGGAVDRGRTLAFTFDGRPYQGFAGDSIASALLANGVSIVGRSFKYHRPRGLWGAWTEEPNAIVDVTRDGATTPNLRATTEPLENDMAVRSVNAAPNAAADRAAIIDRLAPMLPAGFYYKTFLWPRWETFEGSIRAMAGLGRVDTNNRPLADNPQINACCDLLVIGAGPAGLAAAAAAARAGRVVFLIDDHCEIGGQLVHRGGSIEGGDWRDWAHGVVRAVEAAGGRAMTRTTAYGVYDGDLVCAGAPRAGA
jgi:sarcosine oxidase subunit alpha